MTGRGSLGGHHPQQHETVDEQHGPDVEKTRSTHQAPLAPVSTRRSFSLRGEHRYGCVAMATPLRRSIPTWKEIRGVNFKCWPCAPPIRRADIEVAVARLVENKPPAGRPTLG